MKYQEIKKALNDNGFEFKYHQTDSDLDLLMFENSNIEGCIDISFGNVDNLPDEIRNVDELDYSSTEWLNDFDVKSICFNIDIGISYMSEDVIDACGRQNDNRIYLYNEDIKYFHNILWLITSPRVLINYIHCYNYRVNEFLELIVPFISILNKYDVNKFSLIRSSENPTTTVCNLDARFESKNKRYIYFSFNCMSNKIKIAPQLTIQEDYIQEDITWNLTEFEKYISYQIKDYEELLELYEEHRKSLYKKLKPL